MFTEVNEQVQLDNIGSFPLVRDVIREIVLKDEILVVATTGQLMFQSDKARGTFEVFNIECSSK